MQSLYLTDILGAPSCIDPYSLIINHQVTKGLFSSHWIPAFQVGDNVLDYNPQFMFYITTKLSNPHYTPEVSTKTTIATRKFVGESGWSRENAATGWLGNP
jgi:hypothetical protein